MFDDRGVRPGLQIAKIITNLVLIAVVIWLIVIVYDLGNKISENQQIPTDSIPWEPMEPSIPKDETIPWTPLEPSIPNEEDDTPVAINLVSFQLFKDQVPFIGLPVKSIWY